MIRFSGLRKVISISVRLSGPLTATRRSYFTSAMVWPSGLVSDTGMFGDVTSALGRAIKKESSASTHRVETKALRFIGTSVYRTATVRERPNAPRTTLDVDQPKWFRKY